MSFYIHLHVHTEFSRFDGYNTVEQLYEKAYKERMTSIAITDHHNVFSWFHMAEMEKKYPINSIFGIELNVGKNHITALAMNEKGLQNIWKLNNIGYAKRTRPKINEKDLELHSDGVFFLSGCSRGKVPNLLFQNKINEAISTIKHYQHISKGNFALEIQNYGRNNQNEIRNFIRLGVTLGVEVIPTNDCHYLDKEDYLFHSKMLSMRTNGNASQHNQEYYFKTVEEMNLSFPSFILEQTKQIEKKCSVDFPSFLKKQVGNYEIPICKIDYFSDADSIRGAFFLINEYKLGNFFYKKLYQEGLRLEGVSVTETTKDALAFAYKLRGKVRKISAHPYLYTKVNEDFPIFRDRAKNQKAAQIDEATAIKMNLPLYDSRIITHKKSKKI